MLGERLTRLRKDRNLTQTEIANRLHISRSTYAQYEVERRVPEYGTLEKMADFFEVSIDYLVGRTDERNRVLSEDARVTIDLLHLDDEEILKRIEWTENGVPLSRERALQFIQLIRLARGISQGNADK